MALYLKIVRTEALVKQANGKVYFDNRLFTGVALTAEKSHVVSKKRYENGVLQGDYIDPYMQLNTQVELLAEYFDNLLDIPIVYNEEGFDGIVYDFHTNGVCQSQQKYLYGCEDAIIRFNLEGRVNQLCTYNDNSEAHQAYKWSDSGVLCETTIYRGDKGGYTFELDGNLRLKKLDFNFNFFQDVKTLDQGVLFGPGLEEIVATTTYASKKFFLEGKGINEAFFNYINTPCFFQYTQELILYNVNFDIEKCLYNLLQTNIKEVCIIGCGYKKEEIKTLQKQFPQYEFTY